MSTLADLLVKIGVDNSGVDKGTKETESKFEKTWNRVKATAAVAGAAIGLAVATSAVSAMDVEAANDKLAAQLGATAQEADRLGKVAGDLYAGAWGESAAQVNEAVGAVVTSIDGMRTASTDALEAMTAKALDFATTFEVDVTRATQVVGQVVSSGLAKDATQALDLLTVSMQRVPAAVREDLVDAVDEYGPFMASIGVTGEKAFGLLVKASEKGMFGLDKTGDALKEFTILTTDMSAASKAGYDALGLSQEDMTRKLLAGGQSGAAAFDQIVDGLLRIQDPVKQSQAALALFGTPLEDLNVSEIPKFLQQLDATQGGLGDVAGATDKLGATLNDNAKTDLTAFKRQAEAALVNVLSEAAPHLETVGRFLQDNATWVKPLAVGLGGLAIVIGTIIVLTKIWTAVQTAFGIVMNISLGPVWLIVLAVIALIAIIALVATKTRFFQTIWEAVWGAAVAAFQWAVDWIVGGWKWVIGTIIDIALGWWSLFTGFWSGVGEFFVDLFKAWWGLFTGFWSMIFGGVADGWKWVTDKIGGFVDFVGSLPRKISEKARGMFDGLVTAGRGGINKLIGLWNRLDFGINIRVPDWVPGLGGRGFSVPDLFPDIPMLAAGGIVPASPGGTLALLGEGRHDEAVVPLPRGATQLGGGGGAFTATVEPGMSGTPVEQDVASLVLHLIRVGALNLVVRNGQVMAPNG
jgi:phage-related minor tail protein